MTIRQRLPNLATAALAVLAHVVLLLAPLTCACDAMAAASEGEAAACCCKPGDAPMPCSTGRGVGGAVDDAGSAGCTAQAACACQARMPASSPHVDRVATLLVALPLEPPTRLVPPPPAFRGSERQATGPPPTPMGLRLVRSSTLII